MELNVTEKKAGENIREYALRVLRDNIMMMKLLPGMAIVEPEVTQLLGTSRTPVREACMRLAQDGLLEVFPQRGTYVTKIDLEQVEESFFLRETMENAVMRLACRGVSQEAVYRLQDNLTMQKRCMEREEPLAFFRLDDDFHSLIYEACRKKRVWNVIAQAAHDYNRLRIMNVIEGSYEMKRIVTEHEKVFEAIKAQDLEAAEQFSSSNIKRIMNDVKMLYKKHPDYFLHYGTVVHEA